MQSNVISITPSTQFTPVTTLPQVALSGMNLVVNGSKLSLTRKARAYRVVRAFFAHGRQSMSTEELLQLLDEEEGLPRRLTVRAKKCQHVALVRMFSRMRGEFQAAFARATPSGTSWFHFDRAKNRWVLFKMPATGADGCVY